jgi:putative chitinase
MSTKYSSRRYLMSEYYEDFPKITASQLIKAFEVSSVNANKYAEPLNEAMWEFDIVTNKQKAMFLAQCCHESGHFRAVSENLNYSADGLRRVFPKYFRTVDPNAYHRKPEKIASLVYANRMGNGSEASGDGWRFRGRGLIQLTGKNNYMACGEDLEVDLIAQPEYLETPEGAARSAAWFWWQNDLNLLADKGDIKACTRRINGGFIGLADRIELYEAALEVFGD